MARKPENAMKEQSFTWHIDFMPAIIPPSTGYHAPSADRSGMKPSSGVATSAAGLIFSCSSERRKSSKVRAASNSSGWSRASIFLAMQGPMKIVPISGPSTWRNILQWVSSGESRPVSKRACSGRYFCRKLTTVGQAEENRYAIGLAIQQRRCLRRDLLGAQGRLGDAGKTEPFQGVDKSAPDATRGTR